MTARPPDHLFAPFVLFALFALWAPLPAQEPDTVRLRDVVVTATRSPVPTRQVGSSVDRLGPGELRRRQINSLREALQLLPGGPVLASGGAGAVTSLFLRGVASSQTLLLIDGVRMNDANANAGILLGGADLGGLGTLELVRGPQSTLYGGAAIGGLISLDAIPGSGPAWAEADLEGGTFSTWHGRVTGSGSAGRLGISASLSANGTENERRPNDWHQRTQMARLDYRVSSTLQAGATFRGWQQEYTSPGDLRTTNTTPVGTTMFRSSLGTLWVEATPHRIWHSKLLGGFAWQRLRDTSRFDGFESVFVQRHRRRVLDWQNTLSLGNATVLAGINREWSTLESDTVPAEERLWGVFGEARVRFASVVLTAGLRTDDYNTFADAWTYRLTGAWWWDRAGAKVRASLGTGFMPPSIGARFGDTFLAPNPGIRPERSRGLDVGVDREFGPWGRVGVTWFHNTLKDLIAFESAPFPEKGRLVNLQRARTWGVELTGRVTTGPADLVVAYTLLSARNLSEPDTAPTRLIRRPRHTLSADIAVTPRPGTSAGAGLYALLDRVDSDFNQFPAEPVNPGDFATVRLYATQDIGSWLTLRVRVDNALDRLYEPVYGFPALGRTVTASGSVRIQRFRPVPR
ncbi:MAG: TonB-dependent receptor plug domain-containing protein [Gemmatimonadales bacterium]